MILKKPYLLLAIALIFVLLIGWFLYINYLKHTLHQLQKSVITQIDSVANNTKTPQAILNKNCKYDLTTQTDDFLKGIPEFSDYSWDDQLKQATITLNDSTILMVERGGCNQFKFYGTLRLQNSNLTEKNQTQIFTKAMWIAEKLFENQEYEFFRNALETENYEIQKYDNQFLVIFDTSAYCNAEILFIRHPKNGTIEIKIGYYLC